MTEAQLKSYGWVKDVSHVGTMCWRDPLAKLSWYIFRDAVIIQQNRDYKVECCNEECGWTGKRSQTVVFKHDKGKENIPLFCPECHEICEPE